MANAYKFQQIAQAAADKFGIDQVDLPTLRDNQSAMDWLRRSAARTRRADPEKLMDGGTMTSQLIPGRLYLYQYNPKMAEQLPYWDRFPLTFITDIEGQYFYGLNMHYLPPMRRAILMDNLYKNIVNESDATARVRISYSILKKASSMPGWKACFKKYIKRRVRGRFMMVDPNNWDIAVQLPLARFQKASINRVYGDSRKLI